MNILTGTPIWVFGLFVVIGFFSIHQSQARNANMVQLGIFTALLVVFSISKLIGYSFAASIIYLSVLIIACHRLLKSLSVAQIKLSPSGKELILNRSYLRGAGIMSIFFIQYYMSARHAVTGSSLANIEYSMIACGMALSSSPLITLTCKGFILRRKASLAKTTSRLNKPIHSQ